MNNKIKEFQNRIESLMATREELVESTQSLEGQLVKKRNELNSIIEKTQIKTMAMERYYTRRRQSIPLIFVFLHSEYKRGNIHNSSFEKKMEIAEQQVEDLKLAQENLITMGIEVVEHIQNSQDENELKSGVK